jgi:hypothetical protein
VLELATRVAELVGGGAAIRTEPLPQHDPVRRRPDIGRARSLLGWEPAVGLDEGLARTVAHFEARLAASDGVPAVELPEPRDGSAPVGAATAGSGAGAGAGARRGPAPLPR